MEKEVKIWIVYIFICIVWGTTWSVIKIGLTQYPPLLFASVRFSIGFLFLGLFLRNRDFASTRSKQFWILVIVVALFAYALPTALTYYAQLVVPSSLASVLFSTFPLWVTLATKMYLPSEYVTKYQVLGIVIGLLGIFLILHPVDFRIAQSTSTAMIAILVSAFVQVIPLIAARKLAREYTSISYNFFAMGIASVVLFALSSAFHEQGRLSLSPLGILSLLYLGIFATAIAFVGYFWLTAYVSPVILSLSAFITPLIAILIGTALFDEPWSANDTIGTIAILTGLLLTIFKKNSSLSFDDRTLTQSHKT